MDRTVWTARRSRFSPERFKLWPRFGGAFFLGGAVGRREGIGNIPFTVQVLTFPAGCNGRIQPRCGFVAARPRAADSPIGFLPVSLPRHPKFALADR